MADAGDGAIDRVVVILDIDPFTFLEKRGAAGQLSWTRIGLRMHAEAAEAIEVFCVSASDQPGILYLDSLHNPLPPGGGRVLETTEANRRNERRRPPEGWGEILPRVLGHLVREESRFGDLWD